ncbi:ATP-binding protein [Nanoarchaeota archaeon]
MSEVLDFVRPTKLFSFTDHMLVSGKSGSGKSNTCEFLATQQVGKVKVIDVYDDGRHENFLYGLPEQSPKLIYKMLRYSDEQILPRTYQSECFMIAGNRLQYIKKLPANIQVVSLDEDTLNISDLYYLLGHSDSSRALLSQLQFEQGDMSLRELLEFLEQPDDTLKKMGVHFMSKYSILRSIKRWIGSGMFSDDFPKLDIKKVLKDKKTITSFSSYLLEEESQKALFYGLLLKQVLDAKRWHQTKHRVLVYVREISNFVGSYSGAEWSMAQKNLLSILREGRDVGVTLLADTQRARDLHPSFRRQFGTIVQMKADLADADTVREVVDVPQGIIRKIPKLKVGEGLVLSGSHYYYPCFFLPARHMHKKPHLNIMRLLSNIHGTVDYSSLITRTSTNSDPPKIEVENPRARKKEEVKPEQ